MDADRILDDAGIIWGGFGSASLFRAEVEVAHLHELAELCPYVYLDVSLLFCQLQMVGYLG